MNRPPGPEIQEQNRLPMQSMWAESERQTSQPIFVIPAPFPLHDLPLRAALRSIVFLQRPLSYRSAPLRSAPLHPIFGPLRSRSVHMLCAKVAGGLNAPNHPSTCILLITMSGQSLRETQRTKTKDKKLLQAFRYFLQSFFKIPGCVYIFDIDLLTF